MISVLLIWSDVPERLRIYEMELNEDDFKQLQLCNGNYINQVKDSKGPFLSEEWLIKFACPDGEDILDSKGRCIFDSDLDKNEIEVIVGRFLIVTGFLL